MSRAYRPPLESGWLGSAAEILHHYTTTRWRSPVGLPQLIGRSAQAIEQPKLQLMPITSDRRQQEYAPMRRLPASDHQTLRQSMHCIWNGRHLSIFQSRHPPQHNVTAYQETYARLSSLEPRGEQAVPIATQSTCLLIWRRCITQISTMT